MFQYAFIRTSQKGCSGRVLAILLVSLYFVISSASAKKYLKGRNATLSCKLDSVDARSSPSTALSFMSVRWDKHLQDGEQILVASSVYDSPGLSPNSPLAGRAELNAPTLHIRNLKVTDSATYRCEVIGISGSITKSESKIEVNAVPNVEVVVREFPALVASTGLYSPAVCRANAGRPAATIKWINTANGQIQDFENSMEVLEDGSFNVESILRLKPGLIGRLPNSTDPVTSKDWEKNFTCVVSHEYFEDQEQAVTVSIKLMYPPIVTISFKSNKLTCNALGNPLPFITWKRPDGTTESGGVGSSSIFVDQTTPSASSGRYVCLARSSIGPGAVSAIDVEKSSDLPILFTSTLRYNASLPLNAKNYDMECSAELENMERSARQNVSFIWTKNGKDIEVKLSQYSISQRVTEISSEKYLVTSTLRILQVRKRHDEGVFKCRLSHQTPGTGYVRALQRAISVKVDYPPSRVVTTIYPDMTVKERTNVDLSCRATSSPPSSYLWFFNGKAISSRSQLLLRNISRNEAGSYKCVAFNYVPGSAYKEVRLVVKYPPGRVVITKDKSSLSCSTVGGSVPPPLYTWLLPNGTLTDGNMSVLEVPSFDVSSSISYTCLVGNGLQKTSNSTFYLQALKTGGIGALTIGEFVVTVIVGLLVLVITIVAVVWIAKRYEWRGKSGVPKNKKDYDTSVPMPNGKSTVMSPKTEGKPALVNFVTLASKSNLAATREDGKDPPSKYRSVEVLDGSGIEILENASMDTSSKFRESTLPRAAGGSPLRMTTFSQNPSNFTDRTLGMKCYNTTRNPAREKVKDSVLTRALSENFRPVLFDDTVKPTRNVEKTGVHQNKATTNIEQPPAYSMVGDRRMVMSPRPAMSTPIPVVVPNGGRKEEKEVGYCSDSSGSSSSNTKSSFDKQISSMSNIGGTPNQAYPGFRHNAVSHDMYNMDFRPSPVPSRCQSADPYNIDYTPPMVEIPSRNYLYHPYAESRLGVPSGPKSSFHNAPATVGSPYDSGSDSKSSNATTVTSSGRRMQSLTLV